ncbi:MAG: insulinase family protein [Candidatus Wildermuthbacteria bacterium]|nr:insulinase family protein [Candidatus Wildermuthbacteria bacterium]
MFEKTTLPNGLRVIAVPHKGTATVTVLALIGTGSKYETRKINGLSHFLEHMFFKGTKSRPSALEVTEPIDGVGGVFNAFTTEDQTGYFIKTDASHINLSLDIVSDIFLNSLFAEQEMAKEKTVVVEEIHMRKDNPMIHIWDLWGQHLYGDQPAGWDIAGTKESVLGLSRQDLLEYVGRQYVAPHAVLAVAGNIDPKEVARKAGKLFASMPVSGFRDRPKVKEAQKKPEAFVEYRKTGQVHIALGVRAFPLSHPLRYAQDLLALLLGGMMSSRLFVEIREKLGIAYSIATASDTNPDTGSLITSAGVKEDSLNIAIQAILREYQRLREETISPKELRKIKDHAIGQSVIALESSDAQASFYGTQELLENKVLTPEEVYGKIQAVKAEDIRRLAREIFQNSRLNLVVLGPFKKKEAFQKLLRL